MPPRGQASVAKYARFEQENLKLPRPPTPPNSNKNNRPTKQMVRTTPHQNRLKISPLPLPSSYQWLSRLLVNHPTEVIALLWVNQAHTHKMTILISSKVSPFFSFLRCSSRSSTRIVEPALEGPEQGDSDLRWVQDLFWSLSELNKEWIIINSLR